MCSRKNNYRKGISKELKTSVREHGKGVPLLVEPKFMRKLGAGQVDLAVITDDRLFNESVCTIFEVKSFAHISFNQRKRLYKSAQILSEVLDMSCRISVIYDDF